MLPSPRKYSFPPETLPFNFGNTDRHMHELVFPTVKAAVTWGSILLGSGPFIWTTGYSGVWLLGRGTDHFSLSHLSLSFLSQHF